MAFISHRFFLLCCLTVPLGAAAQSIGPDAIDAAGGSQSIAGNTFEYAIGQPLSSATFSSASLVVTPGVLQPLINTAAVHNTPIAADALKIYPNPAVQMLFIQPSFGCAGKLRYLLYDAAGKLVSSNEAELKNGNERQSLEVTSFAAGQYQLHAEWLLGGGNTQSTDFKVQKLQ